MVSTSVVEICDPMRDTSPGLLFLHFQLYKQPACHLQLRIVKKDSLMHSRLGEQGRTCLSRISSAWSLPVKLQTTC